ncbi:MAG: hypothetical protein AAB400_04045 [Patescibacteria group bacterium]
MLIISWLLFIGAGVFFVIQLRTQKAVIDELLIQLKKETEYPPPITSNEDSSDERSHFTFSPDKRYVAFVQDVFKEYGEDYDRYWALKIFDPATKEEQSLLVDDSRLSGYEWLNAEIIRVFHNGGTGVRAFKDIRIGDALVFFKDSKYTAEHSKFWMPDKTYTTEVVNSQKASEAYYEKNNTIPE